MTNLQTAIAFHMTQFICISMYKNYLPYHQFSITYSVVKQLKDYERWRQPWKVHWTRYCPFQSRSHFSVTVSPPAFCCGHNNLKGQLFLFQKKARVIRFGLIIYMAAARILTCHVGLLNFALQAQAHAALNSCYGYNFLSGSLQGEISNEEQETKPMKRSTGFHLQYL